MAIRFWQARRHTHPGQRQQRVADVALVLTVVLFANGCIDANAEPASFDDRYVSVAPQDDSASPLNGGETTSRGTPAVDIPDVRDLAAPRDTRGGYRALVEKEAKRENLPPEIAEAVMAVESGFNPAAIGGVGEIGLMQVLPSTARMLGFVGSNSELAVPATNIRYGVTYLAQAWRLSGGDLCTAVMKYRAGHGETRFSYLSVEYCRKVRAKLAARGYAVSGILPTPTFGSALGPSRGERCRGRCLAGSNAGANIAALNAKLSRIVFRVSVLTVPRP